MLSIHSKHHHLEIKIERSISGSRSKSVIYEYKEYATSKSMTHDPYFSKDSFKPGGVSMSNFSTCLSANKEQDRQMATKQESHRANERVEIAANIRCKEHKNMRQNFSIMD